MNLKRVDDDWYDYGDFIRVPKRDIVQFSIGLIQDDARRRTRIEINARKRRSKE
jgi:hypothetical protein